MPRLALFNMLTGFLIVAIAAMGGAFIANDIATAFLRDKSLLDTWEHAVTSSAHGHLNLFGILQVLFGLTLPYSIWPSRAKLGQTLGLLAGSLAMGPLMLWRAAQGPRDGVDPSAVTIGLCLSAALCAIITHALGLGVKLAKRES